MSIVPPIVFSLISGLLIGLFFDLKYLLKSSSIITGLWALYAISLLFVVIFRNGWLVTVLFVIFLSTILLFATDYIIVMIKEKSNKNKKEVILTD